MKTTKLFLDLEEEQVSVGTIKLKKELPYHEFFFKINQLNSYNFFRTKDFRVEDLVGVYDFPKFEAFDDSSQNRIIVIANKSHIYHKREEMIDSLFDLVEEKVFLDKEIDFIVFSKSGEIDFELFLPKESLSMKVIKLSKNEELNHIILNYDE